MISTRASFQAITTRRIVAPFSFQNLPSPGPVATNSGVAVHDKDAIRRYASRVGQRRSKLTALGGLNTQGDCFFQRRWMAGHSKWANIRHKKGAKDKARAAILGKASLGIIAASRACGGDLSNLRLQSAIAHAKSVQLPKDRLEDAIAKGTVAKGDGSGEDLMSLRFDAMLNLEGTKVACIVTALSDNRNRTTSSVRHLVTKDGSGELMPTDSLAYAFNHVGYIIVEQVTDEEALMEVALDAGAINIEEEEAQDEDDRQDSDPGSATFSVTTEDTDLFQVVTALRDAAYNVTQFDHRYILQDQDHGGVELSTEGEDALINFLDKMDENMDVTNVFHNAV